MAERTPGPWKIDGNSIFALFEGEEVQIALITSTRWTYPDGGKTSRLQEQCKANAILFVHSLELLEELTLIVEGWDAIEGNKIRGLSDWEKERREFARAAIEAARGK